MDCSVLLLSIALRWKRVCIAHNNCMSCPSIWATLSALLINILLGSFQLFLHSDQPLSPRGEIIPFSSVCQSGGGCIIHAGGNIGVTHWLTDWQCATDDDQRQHHHAEHHLHFSALASANSFVYFASSAATSLTHLHVSNCRVRPASSLAFLSRWALLGNGVITVMINSPWQADDDADNQSGDNRGDSAHASISLTVRPLLFQIFAIRLSALCSNWP